MRLDSLSTKENMVCYGELVRVHVLRILLRMSTSFVVIVFSCCLDISSYRLQPCIRIFDADLKLCAVAFRES